jgi:hypothetical protein
MTNTIRPGVVATRARECPSLKRKPKTSLSTGEPDAGNPPVRFGGRGAAIQCGFPTPIFTFCRLCLLGEKRFSPTMNLLDSLPIQRPFLFRQWKTGIESKDWQLLRRRLELQAAMWSHGRYVS